ncbi:SusC/RagA family TonB-linked outer membrane protein [Chitinophaga lutea]
MNVHSCCRALIALCAAFCCCASARAQTITLRARDASLESVLQQIERQSGYDVFYEAQDIRRANKVTVDLRNASLTAALDSCFKRQPFKYHILDKTIVVSASIQPKAAAPQSQAIRIRGKVTDENDDPLPGVTVRIRETNTGVVTDKDGRYVIADANPKGTISFSFVGYHPIAIAIDGQTMIDMTLMSAENQLQETVVKGYYTTTRALNTGNVTSVGSKEIARQPVADPVMALQGRVAGLVVQAESGVPGRMPKIRLRGQNSLANGNEPLFIVDGIQFPSNPLSISGVFTAGGNASPFNYLNPTDIERIEVLKDADATAIYGSRGANGVILITTKRGTEGKTQLDVNVYTGARTTPQRLEFMDTQEYLAMRRQAFAYDNKKPGPWDHDLNGSWDTTRSTNWQDYLTGNAAEITEASVSANGGSGQTQFRMGATYRHEGMVYPVDFYLNKTAFQFGVSHKTADNRLSLDLSGSYVVGKNLLPTTAIEPFLMLAPHAPAVYKEDGSLNWANSTWENPLGPLRQTAAEKTKNLIGNLHLQYRIWKGLEVKAGFGYNLVDFSQHNLYPLSAYDPALLSPQPADSRSHRMSKNQIETWSLEPQLSYSVSVGNHHLDALIGTTFQSTGGELFRATGVGYSSDDILKNFAAAKTISGVISTSSMYRYNALYARLGYNYDGKYVLNLTGRRDGSSRFGPGKRFGNFGAIGAAWVFSQESFLSQNVSWLSLGKLRMSYGSTGNDQLGDYRYLDTYSNYPVQYQGNPSFVPSQLTNPFFGWERVNKLEGALELGILENRFRLEVAYYRNRTQNQLVQYGLPSITGFNYVFANLPAEIQNKGWEVELTSGNIETKRLSWTTTFNLTISRNKLLSYPNIEASSYARTFAIGKPVDRTDRMYHYTGKDPATGIYTFLDVNKDRMLTAAQDQIPVFRGVDFFGGLQNNFKVHGFEIDFLFQFVRQTGYLFLFGVPPGFLNGGRGNQLSSVAASGIYQPYTTSSQTIYTASVNFTNSDGSIGDASFARLRNLSISYNIPIGEKTANVLRAMSIYVLCQNLLTITSYRGSDPEFPSASAQLPLQRIVAAGIKATF